METQTTTGQTATETPWATMTDDELMAQVTAGDAEHGLAELKLRHGGRVVSLARGIVRDAHLAEDVCQDVFAKVFLKSHLYRPEGNFRAWISEVTRNQALSAVRSRQHMPRSFTGLAGVEEGVDEEDWPVSHRGSCEERLVEERELMVAFDRAVEALPERYREVFELCVQQGMEYRQAARILSIPTGTVAIRIMRARKRLFQALQACFDRIRRPPACFVN